MALGYVSYRRSHEIILQCQIDIVQGLRQQDGIITARSNCKSTSALGKGWGERKRGRSDISVYSRAKRKRKHNNALLEGVVTRNVVLSCMLPRSTSSSQWISAMTSPEHQALPCSLAGSAYDQSLIHHQ